MALSLWKNSYYSTTFTYDNFYSCYCTLDRSGIAFRLENILYAKLSTPAGYHRLFGPDRRDSQSPDRDYCVSVSPNSADGTGMDGYFRATPSDSQLANTSDTRCRLATPRFVE